MIFHYGRLHKSNKLIEMSCVNVRSNRVKVTTSKNSICW